ncbi:unnamed protein product [Cladocopium goreaui]|uniref:Kanadaptin n=1 Tax=Cladocopium goreaui TaxID=2562237 RepID=A0A9P1D9P3_9DINO|nr:unnamed protein product [Cladocopium goreaui]|mmetsp:Transcript_72901/g.160951  ORF Transcript_72901/g.160951 Transcript_72901/m.160951 type:complete len:642 (-) Transcript_72901:19-1944(-)
MSSPFRDYQKPSWAGKSSLESLSLDLIVSGEVRRRVDLDLTHDAFLIGREKNCDVILEGLEKMASRYHCILQCKEGSPEIYVYDLRSSHGTVVNGKQIDPYKFEPLRVGGQLKFNAIKPTPRDVLAVLCGPEEAMEEEGEIDLTEFREQAAKERAAKEKAISEDLARRKAAKKKRMHVEAQREAVAKAYAAQAEKKMEQRKQIEEADRAKLHQVTWGMADDAVDVPMEELHDDAKQLMDANGKLDLEKVRALTLSQKQEAMVQKLEQKQKKISNMYREKQKQEEQAASRARKKAAADLDIDELPDSGMGTQNMERLQKLTERIEKAEEDFGNQVDVLFVSLGLKKAGLGKISKKTAALYDTRENDSDDEFFDRAVKGPAPEEAEADIPTELMGLPTLDAVENEKSLEVKVSQLKAEKGRVMAQLAAEKVKAKKQSSAGEEEDSLDAFMNATVAELRQDKGDKLQKRLEEVESRLAKFEAMLAQAKTNTEKATSAPTVPKVPKSQPEAKAKAASRTAPSSTAEVLARLTEKDRAQKAEKADKAEAPKAKAAKAFSAPTEKTPEPAPTPSTSAATSQAPTPSTPSTEAKPEAHIDLDKAGLQFLNKAPEAKRRKVYGVAMPPQFQRSRDMDQAASGELEEPQG